MTFIQGLAGLAKESDNAAVTRLRKRIDETKAAKNYRKVGDLVAVLNSIERRLRRCYR